MFHTHRIPPNPPRHRSNEVFPGVVEKYDRAPTIQRLATRLRVVYALFRPQNAAREQRAMHAARKTSEISGGYRAALFPSP